MTATYKFLFKPKLLTNILNYVSEEADCKKNVKFEYTDHLNLDVTVTEDGTNNFIQVHNVFVSDF